MGIVMANSAMSLDGYIAGPNHEMDWVFDHQFLPDEPIDLVDNVIAATGSILSGRGSYDVGQGATRGETSSAFGGRWSGPEFVLTHQPPAVLGRSDIRFLAGDIRNAVGTALAAAGGKNLLVLGANVTQQCLEADLIDEILLFVLPITLGNGIRLFGRQAYRETLFETVTGKQVGDGVAVHVRRRH